MHPASGSQIVQNGGKLKNSNDVTIFLTLSNFFNVVLFLLSSLVTDPRFMSISSLVQELL